MEEVNNIIKEKVLKGRKFVKKHFKTIIITSGVLLGLGANTAIYNSVKEKSYNEGYKSGFEDGLTMQESTDEETSVFEKSISEMVDEYISDKTEILSLDDLNVKKVEEVILEKYNGLGNNLTKENLGCAEQNADYLFKDMSGNYVYNITQNTENLERVNYSSLYVFTDNTNEKRPIAGIVRTEDGCFNVDVKNIDINNGVINQDANKYINLSGTEEELSEYMKDAYNYFKERIDVSKGLSI